MGLTTCSCSMAWHSVHLMMKRGSPTNTRLVAGDPHRNPLQRIALFECQGIDPHSPVEPRLEVDRVRHGVRDEWLVHRKEDDLVVNVVGELRQCGDPLLAAERLELLDQRLDRGRVTE